VQRRLLPHHSNTATPLSVGLSTADLPLEEERKNSKPKGRKTVENRSKRGKEKTKIKLTVCGVCLALQVTLFSPPARKGRGEEVVADPPIRLDFPAAARGEDVPPLFRRPKGFTARCSCGLELPALFPRLFFCNFQPWMCVFRLLLFNYFEFLSFCNM